MQQHTTRQAEIVAIATSLIANGGIQQLTMKKIAQRMGFSEPAIYRHFPSKLDFLLAILASFGVQGMKILQEVTSLDGSAQDKIGMLFGGLMEIFVNQPEITSVIFAEEIFQDDERLSMAVRNIMTANQQVLTSIIKAGQEAGELRDDIPTKDLMTITMGSFRLTVTRWRMSGHSFDVATEGKDLLTSLFTIISAPNFKPSIPKQQD